MLDDVIVAYLAEISEREFDAPFLALLRAEGFYDIHHLHGSYEFGKDAIAKRVEGGTVYQYTFQLKAGNLNQAAWNAVRPQIDQMRYNAIAHPDFDAALPRKPVLVTTGDLIGGAAPDAQQYQQYLRDRGEVTFDVWTRHRFVEAFTRSPELGLVGWLDGPLLGLLSRVKNDDVRDADIEFFSRDWLGASVGRSAVAASVVAHELAKRDRGDLACFTALCLLRAALYRYHSASMPDAQTDTADGFQIGLATRLFHYHAAVMWERCCDDHIDPEAVFRSSLGPGSVITYPVWCMRLLEVLAIYGLSLLEDSSAEAKQIAAFIEQFVSKQPGSWHPISDRHAASIIPVAVLLAHCGHRATTLAWLERIVVWVADRYDGQLGLAGPQADPSAEIRQLVGGPYEHLNIQRRRLSFLATVVLDICCVLECDRLYHDALNDFLAVGIAFPVIEVRDDPGQYLLGGTGVSFEVNIPFDDTADVSRDWRAGAHHWRAPVTIQLADEGFHWQLLSVTLVLRDRYFLVPMRHLARRLSHADGKSQ
jgi:hypothetical protein